MSTINIQTESVIINNYPSPAPEKKQEEEKEEIWKSIPGFPEEYQVSSIGRARKGTKIKRLTMGHGYKSISINKKDYRIANLIGQAFIPKPQSDKPMTIDHIDHDTSNNHVENLQWASASQQTCHQRKRKKSKRKLTSKYKGVSFRKSEGRWQSKVNINGKRAYQELFDNEMDAAAAYDRKAKEVHGKYAVLNNIEESEEYQNFKKNKKWRREGLKNSSSRYYGVGLHSNKFMVSVKDPKETKRVYGGRFISEKEAARKANELLIKIHGPTYNKLNVISSDEEEEEEQSNKRAKYTEEEKSGSRSTA